MGFLKIETNINAEHQLKNRWTLWAHLPHDINWSLNSYKNICSFSTIEEGIVLIETIPEKMIKNCMLFIMKEGINPLWEDEKNINGGSFSYKINNKNIVRVWKTLSYSLMGENLAVESKNSTIINGITISPKKHFCIIKIWMVNYTMQNPEALIVIPNLFTQGCLFKKHEPEF
jgi:hypothetical protein